MLWFFKIFRKRSTPEAPFSLTWRLKSPTMKKAPGFCASLSSKSSNSFKKSGIDVKGGVPGRYKITIRKWLFWVIMCSKVWNEDDFTLLILILSLCRRATPPPFLPSLSAPINKKLGGVRSLMLAASNSLNQVSVTATISELLSRMCSQIEVVLFLAERAFKSSIDSPDLGLIDLKHWIKFPWSTVLDLHRLFSEWTLKEGRQWPICGFVLIDSCTKLSVLGPSACERRVSRRTPSVTRVGICLGSRRPALHPRVSKIVKNYDRKLFETEA